MSNNQKNSSVAAAEARGRGQVTLWPKAKPQVRMGACGQWEATDEFLC